MTTRTLIRALAVLLVATASGCGSGYVLNGRVIEGAGVIMEIASSQADTSGAGVPGASVTLYRDPDRNMERIGAGVSDGQGNFAISIGAFGAGWMQERWLIEVVCRGYETLEAVQPLPSSKSDRWLLVGLSSGRSTEPSRSRGLWDEYQRMK